MIGYVTFRLGAREFACRLDEVREVVRLVELTVLPGMTPPVSGLLELRGTPLPVVDLRQQAGADRGDVLVLAEGAEAMGVAVDQVTAVRDAEELVRRSGEERASGLPGYVVEVLTVSGQDQPVLLVDLRRLADLSAPVPT